MVGAVINDDVKRQFLMRLGGVPLMGNVISPLFLDSRRLMRWRMRMFYAPENAYLLDDERLLSHHRPLRTANSHRAALKTLRNWKANRIEQNADQIRQPTLLIWGEHDADIPLEHGWRLFDAIPGSRLFVFKHTGHLPQEEYPEDFVHVLKGFLSDRERAPEETLSLPEAVFDSRSAAQPAATGADNVLDIDRPIA
jgi:pimeloyl-ACP methyl ester carboxylesterase